MDQKVFQNCAERRMGRTTSDVDYCFYIVISRKIFSRLQI